MVVKEVLEQIEDNEAKNTALKTWKWVKRGFIGLVACIGLYSSLYTIPNDSVGVVQRFGSYSRTTEPGIHTKWPYGIERVTKVPIKRVQKEEFGFRSLRPGIDSQYIGVEEIDQGKISDKDLEKMISGSGERDSTPDKARLKEQAKGILKGEYLMLTGDLNMADMEFIVQYDIKDAVKYLFNIREPKETIRDCSNSIIRQLVGNGSVDEAINIGRVEYEVQSKVELQKLLDDYDTGINIVTVKLQSTNPPRNVRPAFHEVNSAMQIKEQRINEAKRTYNEAVPKAKGEALGLVESAKGYAAERVNKAEGDATKFEQVYGEFKKAPEVTMQRMYLETMSKVLPSITDKWIVEQDGDGGLLKLLHLPSKNPEVK